MHAITLYVRVQAYTLWSTILIFKSRIFFPLSQHAFTTCLLQVNLAEAFPGHYNWLKE